IMLSAKFGVEPTVRLSAFQDLATKRNRMVLVRATVAAPLIASISISCFLKISLVRREYRQGGLKLCDLGHIERPKCQQVPNFQRWFMRAVVSVNVITAVFDVPR